MRDLPTGTVTMLFSDIEGSTRLLEHLGPERYARALARHRELMREAFARHSGYEVDCEGDSFFVAFARGRDALAAAAEAQAALATETWPDGATLRVRMGVHTGEPLAVPPRYVGMDVHKAARIMAAGHGGQVVVSAGTRELVEGALPDGLALRDLGEHRLKDLTLPQRLFELCGEGLERDFPPLETLENRPTNLPAQPTPLIGRERELAELTAVVEETRLLTLTGPGGTGKTRLALQLAAETLERFPAGVFFVALAAVRDPQLVIPTIAQTLGVKEQPGRALAEALAEHLRDKQLLLVLDNVEQVVDAAPALGDLLARAPQLRVVATSREPLRLSGEREYAVEPLPASEAVALFVERARAAKAGVVVDEAVAEEICRRLDGLPLAIELAAARVKLLPLPALLGRLEQRLKLLTGGARDLDERQQTLRAAIDWSHHLLTVEEQTLFRRLAVFAGGWTLEAAEAVCGPAGELDVLDALGSLVDKSLVRQDELAGEPRFSMLETIREYALERLQESGEHDDVRDRHADVVAALAEAARSGQAGPEMPTWLRRLDAEQDNVREALGWLLARRDGVRPLVIAGGLYWYWFMRGRVEEGERWTLQALESAPGDATTARAWALTAAGEYPRFRGEHDRALELKEEALALQRELGATNLVAATLYDIGSIHTARGELARARPLLEEALQLRRAAGRELGIAHALGGVAELALREGDYERARGGFEEMLAIADRNDADDFRIVALLSLASVARAEGDVDRAREHLRACVPRVAELEDVFSLPELLDGTAAVVAGVRPETAARLFGAADAVRETTGMMVWEAERVATVREALAAAIGEDSFRARLEEGRALTFAEAAAAALDALDEPRSTRDRTGAGRA